MKTDLIFDSYLVLIKPVKSELYHSLSFMGSICELIKKKRVTPLLFSSKKVWLVCDERRCVMSPNVILLSFDQ